MRTKYWYSSGIFEILTFSSELPFLLGRAGSLGRWGGGAGAVRGRLVLVLPPDQHFVTVTLIFTVTFRSNCQLLRSRVTTSCIQYVIGSSFWYLRPTTIPISVVPICNITCHLLNHYFGFVIINSIKVIQDYYSTIKTIDNLL